MSPNTRKRKPEPAGGRDAVTGRFQKGVSGNPAGRRPNPSSALTWPEMDALDLPPSAKVIVARLFELLGQNQNAAAAVSASRTLLDLVRELLRPPQQAVMAVMVPTDGLTEIAAFIQAQAEEFGISQESALGLVGALLKGEHGTRLEYEVYDGGCVKTINGPTVEAR